MKTVPFQLAHLVFLLKTCAEPGEVLVNIRDNSWQ